jgi:hypothetical protein
MVDFIENQEENVWPVMPETARICTECNSTMLNMQDGYECAHCGHIQLGEDIEDYWLDDTIQID